MSERLTGKVVLITGASGDIGRTTALVFARHGAVIAVNCSKSQEAAELVEEIRMAGGSATVMEADVTRKAEAFSMVEDVLGQWGKVDVLVNNTGELSSRDQANLSKAELRRQVSRSVTRLVHCIQAVALHMVGRRYGKIVNISPIAGPSTAHPNGGSSAGLTDAVITLTERLALALGPYDINVNALLGDVGEPEDVAYGALLLSSDGRTDASLTGSLSPTSRTRAPRQLRAISTTRSTLQNQATQSRAIAQHPNSPKWSWPPWLPR